MSKEKELTDKQARFVREFCIDWNATQAALRAGYAESGAGVEGHRLLKNAKIAELVNIGRQEFYAKIGMTHEAIAREMAGIGQGKVGKETNGEKLRYTDKMNALDKMAKISGMYIEKVDVNVGGGLKIVIGDDDADCC